MVFLTCCNIFHHFLQLHFDQFVIAVLDLSYTSISTQAQEELCQAKLSSKKKKKKSILSTVEISEGCIFPTFHWMYNEYNFKSTAGQEGLLLPWRVPVSLLGWAGRMD